MPLRPYQTAALIDDAACRLRGARVVCLVAPTGSGKTIVAAEWAAHEPGQGVWVAHRRELLDQAQRTVSASVACRFVMVQAGEIPRGDWYVLDECHHFFNTPAWSTAIVPARNGPTLALTATPERGDGAALGNLADALVVAAQPKQLIADGFLVPCDVVAPAAPTRAMSEHPVTAWRKHADGKKAIVFCRDTKHASQVADDFRDAGVPAGEVEGRMDPELRAARLAAFASGELTVLTNIHVLTEGFDQPDVSCVILCASVSTPGAWIQRIGRALRPSTGKTRAIVLDLRGNVYLHGLPDEDRSYSLAGKAITLGGDESEAVRQCPKCFRCYRASEFEAAVCPSCGFRTPGKPDPKIRRAEMLKVLAVHTVEDRRRKFAELRAIAKARGYSHKWACVRYRLMYQSWPRKEDW